MKLKRVLSLALSSCLTYGEQIILSDRPAAKAVHNVAIIGVF